MYEVYLHGSNGQGEGEIFYRGHSKAIFWSMTMVKSTLVIDRKSSNLRQRPGTKPPGTGKG